MSAAPKSNATEPRRYSVQLRPLKGNADRPPRDLPRSLTVLGSGEGCDVILSSSHVGEAHTAIIRQSAGIYLCDLGAPGGTKLNGRSVRWARVDADDEIGVGPFKFSAIVSGPDGAMSASAPMFSLRNDQVIGTVKSIDPVLVIGSDPGCDVVLEAECILDRHCLIAWTVDGPVLRDLSGRDLTRLNGQRVHSERLRDGDAVGLGPYELLFEVKVNDVPKTPVLMSMSRESNAEKAILGGGLKGLVAGRLPKGEIDGFEDLWPSAHDKPPKSQAENGKPAASEPKPATTPSANKPQATQGNMSKRDPDHLIQQKKDELRSRVAAAQSALDERAQRYRADFEKERKALEERRAQLKTQARALLQAAHEKKLNYVHGTNEERGAYRDDKGLMLDARQNLVASDDLPPEVIELLEEEKRIDNLLSGHVELASMAEFNSKETQLESSVPLDEAAEAALNSLEEKVAELVAVAKSERKELERGEQMMETLRFETERQRSGLTRRQQKLSARESALEKRFRSLTASRESIRKERAPLLARLRELDNEESAIRSRLTESERLNQELIAESEQLDIAQETLETRERELLHKLEMERQRLQRRQTELRRKAARLVKAAREKRLKVEQEVAARQAELEAKEAELRARRMELEESARGELQRTASELESVLNIRLGDIEADLQARSADLEERLNTLSGRGESMKSLSKRSGVTLEDPLRKMAAELSTYRLVEETLGEGESSLDSIEEEILSLGDQTRMAHAESNQTEHADCAVDQEDTEDAAVQTSSANATGATGDNASS